MTDIPRPLPGGAPEAPDPMVGRMLGDRYRIDRVLARGGMARVYRAHDQRLDRDVAVKVLSPPFADDPGFSNRFLGEGRAAASVSHPSLVHVYDSGSDGPAHFIVMELLDRHRSLRDVLAERGRLPRDEVVRIGTELLAGLRAVHDRGLVHSDVKPGNVMLGPGPAKLIDFGISRAPDDRVDSATSIGSLHFMSPEQLHGEPMTPASDLFSLGVVLYEALTGRVPFPGGSPEEVSAAQLAGAVRPPSTLAAAIPGRLDEAILQALRPDPEHRFHGAEAMRRALSAAEEEVAGSRNDDTTVVRPAVRDAPRDRGYVPPPAPVPVAAPTPPRRAAVDAPRRARSRGRGNLWGTLGTLLILGAAALVVVLVVLPLIEAGRQGGGAAPGTSPTQAGTPAAPPAANTTVIPDAVGRPTDEAIATAQDARLDWTVFCNHDESQPEGIIRQEPAPGTEVAVGAEFSMFSARIGDCED